MVKAVKAAQLADQIRDLVAKWSTQDLLGYFFSLTQVTLSTDMQVATIWVDVLQPEHNDKIMGLLRRNLGRYQRRLHQSLQRQIVPSISFKLDDRPQIEARFDELLKP